MKSIAILAAVTSLLAVASSDAVARDSSDCTVTHTPLPTITIYSCDPEGNPGKPPQDDVPSSNPPTGGNGESPPADGNGGSPPSDSPGEPGHSGDGSDSGHSTPGGGNGGSSPENPDQPETVPGGSDGGNGSDQPDTVPVSEGSRSKAASMLIALLGFLPLALP